jgi:molybdenum cofactor biosynthesis protein MoaC
LPCLYCCVPVSNGVAGEHSSNQIRPKSYPQTPQATSISHATPWLHIPGHLPRASNNRPSQSQPYSTKSKPTLPHLTPTSEVHVVDISEKARTKRVATAIGHVVFSNPLPHQLIRENTVKKGDVLAVARVAGVMAAKKTSDIIPLCHNGVGLDAIRVEVELVDTVERVTANSEMRTLEKGIGEYGGIRIQATVECEGKTGVEMEGLTAVVGAGLTVVDMCKGVDKFLSLQGVKMVLKHGGRSGSWRDEDWVE